MTSRDLWTVAIVAIGALLFTTPGLFLHPDAFGGAIHLELDRLAQKSTLPWDPDVYVRQFRRLTRAVGGPLAVASVAGLALPLRGRSRAEWVFAGTIVVYLLIFGAALQARYMVMLLPLLALFAGGGLARLATSKRPKMATAGRVLAVIVGVHAVGYTCLGVVSRYPDTRTEAAEYIHENLPDGSTIGIGYVSPRFGWTFHRWRYPTIDFERFTDVDFLSRPDLIVLSSYDTKPIRQALRSGLLSEGYVLPLDEHRRWYRRSPPPPEVFRMVEALDAGPPSGYALLQRFEPRHAVPIALEAPEIELYARNSNPREAGGAAGNAVDR